MLARLFALATAFYLRLLGARRARLRLGAALPQARLEVLPGCGHAVHLECPRLLVQALQRFRRATTAVADRSPKPVPTAAGRRV